MTVDCPFFAYSAPPGSARCETVPLRLRLVVATSCWGGSRSPRSVGGATRPDSGELARPTDPKYPRFTWFSVALGTDATFSMKRDRLPLVKGIRHWSKHRRCRSSADANDSQSSSDEVPPRSKPRTRNTRVLYNPKEMVAVGKRHAA